MGKYEFDLVVSKTKAVLTGYTGLFQEVIIMKTVNVSNSLVAREIACAIEVYRHFSIVDGYPDNLTNLAYTYETAKKQIKKITGKIVSKVFQFLCHQIKKMQKFSAVHYKCIE